MLSDEAKRQLSGPLRLAVNAVGIEAMRQLGAVALVHKRIQNGRSLGNPLAEELADNRGEAEQYLADLLANWPTPTAIDSTSR